MAFALSREVKIAVKKDGWLQVVWLHTLKNTTMQVSDWLSLFPTELKAWQFYHWWKEICGHDFPRLQAAQAFGRRSLPH